MMRGETTNLRQRHTANVLTPDGKLQSQIVTTWVTKLVITAFFVILLCMLGLMALIVYNKSEIDEIRRDIETENNKNVRNP